MKRYEHNFGKNPQGALSTVSGYATETTNFGETAFGILNKSTIDKNNFTTPEVVSSSTATLFSVGNGTDTDNRKNIIELKADGTVFISGVGGYDGTNPGDSKDISKELQSVHDDIDNINLDIDRIDSDIDSIHVEQDSDLVYTFIVKGENRGTINIPRDQFLKDVNYDEETNILEFLFIVRNEENEEEQKVVKIDMTDLEDIYTNGDGLNLENKKFSIKIDADTQPYIDVSSNGLKIIGINEALDKKVSWDESKKVITLPADGSISALRNNGLEGGVLICQRTYDDGATYVTEVGTTKNNLTLNSIERPQIDFAGGTSENIAYESEVKSLQDRMSTAETDIDNLEGRMDTAESDIDTIQSDLSELIGDGEGSVQDQIKTALEDYLPLSGGTMTGNITFGSESEDYTGGIIISGKSDQDLVNAVGGTTTIDSIREGLATEDALNEYKTSNDEKIQSIEDKLDQEIEAGNTDKETIDNYTVNGHKISENPVLTKTDIGLNQVDNVQQIPMSMKGQAGGVAELDANGKVPSSQLESLALGEVAGTAYEGNKGAANKAAIGTNTYTGANYISKETNLTDAVVQLDEEIKATNDNLALEHANAEATYAKKTDVPTNVSQLTNDSGYQTEAQVAAKVSALVDSAPETLDTLNELAAALGDDPNFATTVTNQIASKVNITDIDVLSGEPSFDYIGSSVRAYFPGKRWNEEQGRVLEVAYAPFINAATSTTAGVMSATDKDRIDKLYTSLSNFGPITHVLDNNAFTQEDGNLKFNFVCTDPANGSTSKSTYNLNVPLATQSQAGVMSASDKSKLDGIASGANKTTMDSALSSISTNPVQNRVISSALDGKAAIRHTHAISDITNLQSTLDGKAASSHTHPVSQITGLTASRALVSDSNGHPTVSAVTSTELGYLDGVTSNVQTQLNGKAASSHTHTVANISNLGSNWATALTAAKPNWITSVNIATISDLNANWDALLKSNPSGYVTRWPNISEVGSKQNLVVKLNGGTTEGTNQFTYNATAAKSINITPSSIGAAASSHTHTAAQVSGLATVAKSGNYNDLSNKPSIPQPTVKAASGNLTLWTGTESEYNDIATKDPNTLYFILES